MAGSKRADLKLWLIHWQDAYITNSKPSGVELTVSVGWIVKEGKHFTTISHFFDGIGGKLSSPYTRIPKGMIKKKERLYVRPRSS